MTETTTESMTRDPVATAVRLRCQGRTMQQTAAIMRQLGYTNKHGGPVRLWNVRDWTKGKVELRPKAA